MEAPNNVEGWNLPSHKRLKLVASVGVEFPNGVYLTNSRKADQLLRLVGGSLLSHSEQ